jgi:transformation/transcription domain-associated protein
MQKDYEDDFLRTKQTHYEYIQRLQQWRDRYEKYLDSRPRIQPLDLLSHYLTEFQYGKFDDIEVPGQYTEVCGFLIRFAELFMCMSRIRTLTPTRTS